MIQNAVASVFPSEATPRRHFPLDRSPQDILAFGILLLGLLALQGAGPGGTDFVASNTASVFAPKTPEIFIHDDDGNLTRDGRWNYAWDAENRPTTFTSSTNLPAASRRKLDCAYDPHFRRTRKVSSIWNGYDYVPQATNHFVYDGWNLVAQFDGSGRLQLL